MQYNVQESWRGAYILGLKIYPNSHAHSTQKNQPQHLPQTQTKWTSPTPQDSTKGTA